MHLDRLNGFLLGFDLLTVNAGSYGPYNANNYPGYAEGFLAPGSAPSSGTIAGGGLLTITWHYDKMASITYLPGSPEGGTGGSTDTVASGSQYTIKSGDEAGIVMPDGWSFAYWTPQRDGSGTRYHAGTPITISGDMTLYSRYEYID
jgi:hypothetical protein